jgi:hypothetical protein
LEQAALKVALTLTAPKVAPLCLIHWSLLVAALVVRKMAVETAAMVVPAAVLLFLT